MARECDRIACRTTNSAESVQIRYEQNKALMLVRLQLLCVIYHE